MAETKKYLDLTGLELLWGKIKDNFVLKEDGKGLSSNDYTADEKSKLNGIEAGAQVNVIEGVAVRSTDGTVQLPNAKVDGTDYSVAVLDVEKDLSKVTQDVSPLHVASAYGVKSYVDDSIADVNATIAGKNVSAEGDGYVSATAADNKVTVAATASLTGAVAKANSAVQTVTGDDYVSATAVDNKVTLSTKVAGIATASAAKQGLADAYDVKGYVDDAVNDLIGGTSDKWAGQKTLYGIVNYTDEKITEAVNEVKGLVTAATQFLGVSDVVITDGATTSITVNGEAVTAGAGDIAMYGTSEFIWDGAKWVLLGDTTAEAAAIEDLNKDLDALTTRVSTAESDIDNLEADVDAINKTIEANEKTTSAALADLNSRVDAFEAITESDINTICK